MIVMMYILTFLDKGVKVVRSPSDILALIKSCDSSADAQSTVASEIVEPDSVPIDDFVSPFAELPQNVPQKILKTIGPRRAFKSTVRTQTFESERNREVVKDVLTQPTDSLRSKK